MEKAEELTLCATKDWDKPTEYFARGDKNRRLLRQVFSDYLWSVALYQTIRDMKASLLIPLHSTRSQPEQPATVRFRPREHFWLTANR